MPAEAKFEYTSCNAYVSELNGGLPYYPENVILSIYVCSSAFNDIKPMTLTVIIVLWNF